MCRLRNIAMCDYQESVTTRQTDRQTDRQTQDKVIPMCHYASQATQKPSILRYSDMRFEFICTICYYYKEKKEEI